MASYTTEDVRAAFYAAAQAGQFPVTCWITEIQVDPPQLVVMDDAAGKTFRVPYTMGAACPQFGTMVQVTSSYSDVAAAGPRPVTITYRGGQLAAAAARSGAVEEGIAAAVARGAITPGRAVYWRAQAATGEDVSILNHMAAPPVPVVAGPGSRPVSWQASRPLWPDPDAAADDDDGMIQAERADLLKLYPPRTPEEAEVRHAALEAAAGQVLDYNDDELMALLFGSDA